MKQRNKLDCPKETCRVKIWTEAMERNCYKCETRMIFTGREGERNAR